MATLMQKDALIERVASVLAMIARKTPRSEGRTPEQSRLVALRRELYASEPEDIDFDKVVSAIRVTKSILSSQIRKVVIY